MWASVRAGDHLEYHTIHGTGNRTKTYWHTKFYLNSPTQIEPANLLVGCAMHMAAGEHMQYVIHFWIVSPSYACFFPNPNITICIHMSRVNHPGVSTNMICDYDDTFREIQLLTVQFSSVQFAWSSWVTASQRYAVCGTWLTLVRTICWEKRKMDEGLHPIFIPGTRRSKTGLKTGKIGLTSSVPLGGWQSSWIGPGSTMEKEM